MLENTGHLRNPCATKTMITLILKVENGSMSKFNKEIVTI